MKLNLSDIVELAQDTAMDVWGRREPIKIIEKLKEETNELEEALVKLDGTHTAKDKLDLFKEFGDTMFCLVRLARELNIDPIDALALTIVKIQERDKFGVANRTKDVQTNSPTSE